MNLLKSSIWRSVVPYDLVNHLRMLKSYLLFSLFPDSTQLYYFTFYTYISIILLSPKILIFLFSTVNDRNEPLPADELEPELFMTFLQSGTIYLFFIDTISTSTICNLTVIWALLHFEHPEPMCNFLRCLDCWFWNRTSYIFAFACSIKLA